MTKIFVWQDIIFAGDLFIFNQSQAYDEKNIAKI